MRAGAGGECRPGVRHVCMSIRVSNPARDLPHVAVPEWRGALRVSCTATGLAAELRFK